MPYTIKTISSKSEIQLCEEFTVEQNNGWGYSYSPKTTGRMGYIQNSGFLIEMTCFEKDPLTRYANTNDPVYTDSAMEAFIDFNPFCETPKYINFEFNSNGALLASYRKDRQDKTLLTELTVNIPIVETVVEKDFWKASLFTSLEFIGEIFGINTFNKGDILKGNFFKIGENDINPHFLSYAPIKAESPNFHLPEFFDTLTIG